MIFMVLLNCKVPKDVLCLLLFVIAVNFCIRLKVAVDVCLLTGTMLPVWKLIGFVLYVVLYFSTLRDYTVWPVTSVKSVFFKVMPVVHLVVIVISTSLEDDIKVKSSRYRWSITLGLIACSIGDCCVFYAEFLGLIMFSIAHLFYIYALGIRPVGSGPMAASFAVAMVAFYFFFIDMLPEFTVKIAVVLYVLEIFITTWRSMAVFHNEKSFDSFLACLGSILFIVSDTLFIYDKFHASLNRAPFWIMLAYYVAQLGLTLSACNTHSHSLTKKND